MVRPRDAAAVGRVVDRRRRRPVVRRRRPLGARAGPEDRAPGGIGRRRHDGIGAFPRSFETRPPVWGIDLEHDVAGHELVDVPTWSGCGPLGPLPPRPPAPATPLPARPAPRAGEAAHAARAPGITATPASPCLPRSPPDRRHSPRAAGPPLPAGATPATPLVPPPPVLPPPRRPWRPLARGASHTRLAFVVAPRMGTGDERDPGDGQETVQPRHEGRHLSQRNRRPSGTSGALDGESASRRGAE